MRKLLLLTALLSCTTFTVLDEGKMKMCMKCCDHNGQNCQVTCL